MILFFGSQAVAEQKNEDLNLLVELLPKHCAFTGDFHQKRFVRSLPAPVISQGSFFFSCQAGLIWHTQSPINESLVYVENGDSFQIRPKQPPQKLKGRFHSYLSYFLLNLLAVEIDYLVENFSIESNLDSLARADNKEGLSIVLRPLSKSIKRAIRSIVLTKWNEDTQLSITNTSGETTQVTIENVKEQMKGDLGGCIEVDGSAGIACDVLLQ